MNYSNFKQGDVVIADIIYAEQIGIKRRPALVISNTNFNQRTDDLILLKISSKEAMQEYDIPLSNPDLKEGELTYDSKIMVDIPVTAFREVIRQKIGAISLNKLNEVKQKMRELYEL